MTEFLKNIREPAWGKNNNLLKKLGMLPPAGLALLHRKVMGIRSSEFNHRKDLTMKKRAFLLFLLALSILCESCAGVDRSIKLKEEWQRTKNIEPIINSLQDESAFVRGPSIEILAKTKDPRAVEPLIAVLKEDKSWGLRQEAAMALGEIKDPRAVEPLIDILKEDECWVVRQVRPEAIQALGEIKDPRAVEPLIDILKNVLKEGKRWEVRQLPPKAIQALGEIKDPRAVEPLIDILKEDKSWQVRQEAATALGEIKDPRAVEPLIDILKEDKSWQVRQEAATALGEIKDPRAVEPLIDILKEDKSWQVRPEAATALGEIKDPRAVEPIINWASDHKADGDYQNFAIMNEKKLLAPGKLGILSVANVAVLYDGPKMTSKNINIRFRKASIGKIIEENFVECFKYLAGYYPVIINASEEIGVSKRVTKEGWEFYRFENFDYQKIQQKYNLDVIIILESYLRIACYDRYDINCCYTTLTFRENVVKLSNNKVLYRISIPGKYLKCYTLRCSEFKDIGDASVDSIRKSYQECSKREMIKLIVPFIYELN